jgi:catechol 2,3-dioxygenase-like lactoylglutathione lyase family enzyme
MPEPRKARAVGFNHIALEVGDIDEALAFYGRLFDLTLRGRSDGMAFIDLGDQFLALQQGRRQGPDDGRHFGLVVDDKEAVRAALAEAGVAVLPGPFLDFLDPWATGSRSSATRASSSPRRRMCCSAWACPISADRAGDPGADGEGDGAGVGASARCAGQEQFLVPIHEGVQITWYDVRSLTSSTTMLQSLAKWKVTLLP